MQSNRVFNPSRTALKVPVVAATADLPTDVVAGCQVFDAEAGRIKTWTGSAWVESLDPDSVDTDGLADSSVTTAKIEDLAVDDTKLAADSVITSKITDLNVTSNKLEATLLKYKAIALSAADIIALSATPKQLLAAVAGKTHIVHSLTLEFIAGTQFTSGGNVVAQYKTGTVALINVIDAAVIQSASNSKTVRKGIDVSAVVASDVELTNATGAFATGDGTAIVHLHYSTV